MVDSRREQPVANEHFKAYGYTLPDEVLALVTSGEMKDFSWHNDASPSYGVIVDDKVTVTLWVDHPKKEERDAQGERFTVSAYDYENYVDLNKFPLTATLISTDDVALAIEKWRVAFVTVKAALAALPKRCEACDVPLNPDLTCPACGVSHSGDKCATCGRFGLHKDDCTEPPGMHTEGGPAHVAAPKPEEKSGEERRAEVLELARTFERAYQYYNGWGFSLEHPGMFRYYQLGGDISVYFTPDYNDDGVVAVQAISDEGDVRSGEVLSDYGDHDFKTDRTAPVLFKIVKPYLDKLAGKSAADLRR